MDDFLTEQQQAEQVRGWLRQNGMFLVAGVVLGLGALFGMNQWNRYQERQAEAASDSYESFLQSVRGNQFEQAEAGMATLAADYGSSPYADQARLAMARLYLERGQADKAAESLQKVVDSATSEEFSSIARLRLARVLVEQKKYDEALNALKETASRAFTPAFHDVRGDVYYAMGKQAEARSEYEQALNGESATMLVDRTYTQAKLDDLGGASAALAPDTAPPAP